MVKFYYYFLQAISRLISIGTQNDFKKNGGLKRRRFAGWVVEHKTMVLKVTFALKGSIKGEEKESMRAE